MPRARCHCGCGQGPHTSTRLRKAECPACGYIVRLSRSCIARGLPTCPCGAQLECPCIYDCEYAGADAVAAHPVAVAESRRLIRPAPRAGHQLQCGGCHAFITATNQLCGCGFSNDIRSGRNQGQWISGAATCREYRDEQAMPF